MAPDEAPARGRPGSIGPPPPKDPRFYGRADQGNAVFSVRRWGKPTHGAPLSAAASLAVVERRPDPRDTPAADRPSRQGALPWAVGIATLARISGSDAGVPDSPSYLSAGRWMGRTEGLVSAFLWRSDTVSFGAVKRNGVGKDVPQRRSLWLFGYFLQGQKVPRRKAKPCRFRRPWQSLKWLQGLRSCSIPQKKWGWEHRSQRLRLWWKGASPLPLLDLPAPKGQQPDGGGQRKPHRPHQPAPGAQRPVRGGQS